MTRILALALPTLLLVAVCAAIAWQIHLAIPFSADDGPVEWLDTALLTLLTAITFGIGVFQVRRRRLAWWTAALGLGLVMILSLADFFPQLVPGIDDSDYPMIGAWAAAAGICLMLARSRLGGQALHLAAAFGFSLHSIALAFDLLDDYLLPSAPGMAAGFAAAREIVELLYLGAYCCAAALIVGRIVKDALSDPAARRAGLSVPAALERKIGRWFKLPAGRKLRIAIEDARWRAWQSAHPAGSFADYYAQQISSSLAAGQPHRTLGRAAYSDQGLFSGGRKWSPERFARRGLEKYAPLRDWGLRPDERVIDYGCGSLRIGQHLIRYLDRGNYIGLDVTDAFYRDGLQMLEPGLAEAKAPSLAVIDDATLARLAQNPPDVILSVAVVMHVPPNELAAFFRRLLSLAGRATRVMLHVDVAARELRTAPKSWAYPTEHFRQLIGALRPDLDFNIELRHVKGRLDGIAWQHGIITLTPSP
jgi:SAM-dependent methyltransferase